MMSFLNRKRVVWSMRFVCGSDTDDECCDTMVKCLLDSVQVSMVWWLDTGYSQACCHVF